ncbi:hypothetical protein ORI20_08090 [Mycobacterium sp. CVI_P3]|uniref:Uncharacterized protein n=1 Tax=Mycobacterium pinniadriaticum TaxID=2994102 RepID=A0ABT3SB31_9MYCO|nr:hypothetical protein [Mycobacterium pinniadriaticum]MCX2930231.1 hypothetical protein [Mycobacterium pinniadriaticum]MCX2936707.1 hypothetical protein [Mycobacterium pinniadriaticum]
MTEGATVVTTRRQLHGIAESFIAGPQYRATGTIRLAVRPDGFCGTTLGIEVHGTTLVWPHGSVRLAGPVSALIEATGLDVGPPATVYDPVAALAPEAVIELDADAAEAIHRSLYAGGVAINTVLPDGHPVLWPEHFDVAASADEVNYGVSAGDDFHPLPYAYVGPWDYRASPRTGPLWNAPFGAVRGLDLAADLDALAADVAGFFGQVLAQL